VHIGLNKDEARNALARAVFFYRLGEIRDRSFEKQQYRASGLTLAPLPSRCGTPFISNEPRTLYPKTAMPTTRRSESISHRSAGSTSISSAPMAQHRETR
jgi:hypothetical protein